MIKGIEVRFRSPAMPGYDCEVLEQTVVVSLDQILNSRGLHPVDAVSVATAMAARSFWQAVVMNGAFDDIPEG